MNGIADFHWAHSLVPIASGVPLDRAAPLAAALKAAGLPSVEVTLRSDDALKVLRLMAEDPEIVVGAGTVVRPDQVAPALAAGARYLVSPGFSDAVARECRELGAVLIPGVATATDIQRAGEAGLSVLKFFPAATSGGAAAVRALSAPFPDVWFIPTGGIDAHDLADYLTVDAVLAVGGSWMVAPAVAGAGDFAEVTRRTADAVATVRALQEARS